MVKFLLAFLLFAYADTPPNNEKIQAEIEVVASRDVEIYVAPIKINNHAVTTQIEAIIDKEAAFTYTGSYAPNNVRVSNGRGGYVPLSLLDIDMMVYSERTIAYHWPDCNYKRDPLKCTVSNSQYLLETIVTVDDNQLVVRATLYDENTQVVGTSTRTNDKIIRWIRQQEITIRQEQQRGGILGGGGQATTIHKPKEELPLRWEIPHTLTDSLVRQTIIGLWTGLKIEY